MGMINNLGTKLFQSVTDKAGNLGDRFEVEFSRLSQNITAEVDAIVTEAISLSGFIKVALVILCILLVLAIIRLSAFGVRCLFFKAKDWIKANENKPPPQVILLMPTENGKYRRASQVYTDSQTRFLLDKLQQDSIDIFNADAENPKNLPPFRPRPPKLGAKPKIEHDV